MAERKGQTAKGRKAASSKGGAARLRANRQASAAVVEPVESLWDRGAGRDIAGVVLAVVAVASLIAVVTPASAPVTRAVAGFYHLGFGLGGYVLPFVILGGAALVFVHGEHLVRPRAVVGAALVFLAVLGLLVIAMTPDQLVWGVTVGEADLARSGGFVGYGIASALVGALGKPIAAVVLVGVAVAGAVLIGFSVSSVVLAFREKADELRERRRVAVNDRPWGDEVPAAPASKPFWRKRTSNPAAAVAESAAGAAPTRIIDDADDDDDNPFVDVSAQLAAERAATTLIPIEDTYAVSAEGDQVDDEAKTTLIERPTKRKGRTRSAAGRAEQAERSESGLTAPAAIDLDLLNDVEDEPPFEPGESHTASGAPTTVIPATAAAQPIPDFLLHPKGAVDGAAGAVPADSAASASTVRTNPSSVDIESDADDETRQLPPVSMLRHNPQSASAASSEKELAQTAESLQATLQEFGLHSRVVGWISGPTVTTFKVQPGEGERVSRISNLEDDIALSLAAQSVRIFAPVPGTSLVGIEIPNRKRQNVFLGDVLPYVQGGPLELAIGRDAEGSPIVADLAKMPHLLIAGTTGSGKSVMINSIITTLLMRTVPEDVRLIMVDPKRVELAGYNGLPHLYVPVVTEPKQAASALQWAVSEMERRLKVFEKVSVRKISTFNEKQAAGEFEHYDNPPARMPYLVIIIDELSDLMMVAGKDVEASIVRIAQLGRAAGIHLIVATQRPSSNVVTGLIKANITNRIAFNVATGIDSRVIIDQMGAEKLTGLGDMLFSKVDWGKPKRIQGCFVSDEEIAEVVDFVREQGEADYHEEILSAVAPATLMGGGSAAHEATEDDPLMWEAAHIVVESGLGSTSGLQRRLKVGYARAGRIMDMLEEKGIVGPPDGSKPREVLLDEEALAELETLEAQMAAEDTGMGGF